MAYKRTKYKTVSTGTRKPTVKPAKIKVKKPTRVAAVRG